MVVGILRIGVDSSPAAWCAIYCGMPSDQSLESARRTNPTFFSDTPMSLDLIAMTTCLFRHLST